MPKVRRNLFNIILVLDLHQSKNIQLIGTLVYNVVSQGLPYRFGLVPLIEDEDSTFKLYVVYGSYLTGMDRSEDGESNFLHAQNLWLEAYYKLLSTGWLFAISINY
jgi:hypothetical protein